MDSMMNIGAGEEIAMMYVSQKIPGTGSYKFLAKKKLDKKFEWVHFVERDSKLKEGVYRGEAKNEEELKLVLDIMNRNLIRIFGGIAEMKTGKADYQSKLGSINGGEA